MEWSMKGHIPDSDRGVHTMHEVALGPRALRGLCLGALLCPFPGLVAASFIWAEKSICWRK